MMKDGEEGSPWAAVILLLIIAIFVGMVYFIPLRTESVLEIEGWCETNHCELQYVGISPVFRWKKVFLSVEDFVEKLEELGPDVVYWSTAAGYTYFFVHEDTIYGLK